MNPDGSRFCLCWLCDCNRWCTLVTGRVAGKIAIITGAGGAIGRTIALALSREGAKVAVCDLDGDKGIQAAVLRGGLASHSCCLAVLTRDTATETVSLIQQQHGEAVSHKVDVSDEKQVSGWISEVTALWGGVDILVNKYDCVASSQG